MSSECDGCIAAHAHAAVRHGASLQEAAETIGVNFLMDGGPATIHGPRCLCGVRGVPADLTASLSAGAAGSVADDGAGHGEHGHRHHQHPEGP